VPKKLEIEKKTIAISMLCEGNSIRGVERMTGIHRDTIMRLAVRVGNGMKQVQGEMFTNLESDRLELDEMWGFVGAKAATAKQNNLVGKGDVWTWIALDSDTKLVPAWHVGKRTQADADVFISDLKSRLVKRPQISTDGLRSYAAAIEAEFGADVDYGSIIKTFSHSNLEKPQRYSPPEVFSSKKEVKQGNPEWSKISTSYVEKQNHTVRMHCRRLARLTNAFSKKRENFEAAISLHFAYYNLVKTHGTIKCTPAMEAGVAETFWKVQDLVEKGESARK